MVKPMYCTDFRHAYRAMVGRDLTQAKARYVFSMVCGQKGHESIALGRMALR